MVESLEAAVAILVWAEQTSRRWWVVITALTDAMSSSSSCSVQVGRSEGLVSAGKHGRDCSLLALCYDYQGRWKTSGIFCVGALHTAGFVTSREPPRKCSSFSLKASNFIVWKINVCVICSSSEWMVDATGSELKRKVMFLSRGEKQGWWTR